LEAVIEKINMSPIVGEIKIRAKTIIFSGALEAGKEAKVKQFYNARTP